MTPNARLSAPHGQVAGDHLDITETGPDGFLPLGSVHGFGAGRTGSRYRVATSWTPYDHK